MASHSFLRLPLTRSKVAGLSASSSSWVTMLSCEVRRKDKEDRLRQEFAEFQANQNAKLSAKTRRKFYLFLKPEEIIEGPRVKDQTVSQILEMLDTIYDRMQYF
uniref:Uncharacterized protein LOC111100905 n=1 Tax=Crassostrea virginica TaxID=6565 RepID=A0A8B8ABD0_CRAVI|nr:uncharacterized protein LOC111100905 [Crassostrea virginica]